MKKFHVNMQKKSCQHVMKANITIRAQINFVTPRYVDLFYCGVWKPSETTMRPNGITTLHSPPELDSL